MPCTRPSILASSTSAVSDSFCGSTRYNAELLVVRCTISHLPHAVTDSAEPSKPDTRVPLGSRNRPTRVPDEGLGPTAATRLVPSRNATPDTANSPSNRPLSRFPVSASDAQPPLVACLPWRVAACVRDL